MTTRGPRPLRYAIFSVLVCGGVLWGLNRAAQVLEDAELVRTHLPDDAVHFVEGKLFVPDGWGNLHTSRYGLGTMVPSRFAQEKGERLRVFVLGGSFAMGSPYRFQGPEVGSGGIASFLEAELEDRLGEQRVEVINAGSGGQPSSRVVEVTAEILDLDPDVLFVATCNNEGTLPPSRVMRYLHRQAGYRLLRAALTDVEPADRPWFAPQDVETERVRAEFEKNLRALADAARRHEVPVLLATLPVNLRYLGFDVGHLVTPADADPGWVAPPPDLAAEVAPEWAGLDPCRAGARLFEAAEPEAALPLLRRCWLLGDDRGPRHMAEWAGAMAGIAELQLGRTNSEAQAALDAALSACVGEGIRMHFAGRHVEAVEHLPSCDDIAEASRWIGLSHLALGQDEEGRAALRQSAELNPRNRCRPTHNEVIRQVAADNDHVHLVDLQARAEALSPQGVPGEELFLDYCHMHWRGYAAMAEETLTTLDALALPRLPPGAPVTVPMEDRGAELGLPPGGNREQILAVLRKIAEDPLP